MATPTTLTRPAKKAYGTTSYVGEYNAAQPNDALIFASDVDGDLNPLYQGHNDIVTSGVIPAGAAGGDLTGSNYPAPVIAAGTVTRAKIAADAYLPPTPVTGNVGQVLGVISGPALAYIAPPGGPPTGNATGDLQGTYPAPQVTAPAKSKWAVTGGVLTPTTVANNQINLGGATLLASIAESATGVFQLLTNNGWAPQDVTKVSYSLVMDPVADNVTIGRRAANAAAGTVTALLTTDSGGNLTANGSIGFNQTNANGKSILASYASTGARWSVNDRWAPPVPANASWEIVMDTAADFNLMHRAANAAAGSNDQNLLFNASGNLVITGTIGQKATGTTWSNPSDIRLKHAIGAYDRGLADILKLAPITYRLNADPDRECYGFDAEQVRAVFPECVGTTRMKLTADAAEETEVLTFDFHPVLVAMVTALKELATMVRGGST
jgi:hypothetical protein